MTALVSGTALAAALDLTYATDTATFDQVADAADELLVSLLSATDSAGAAIDHSTHSTCKEAAIAIAAEMFTARTAVGGSPMSVDFTPGAYRLSVWLTRRVQTVGGRCWDMGGWVG
jgi:hypothetical protein